MHGDKRCSIWRYVCVYGDTYAWRHVCVCACARVRVRVRVCVWRHTCMDTCMYGDMCVWRHICMETCVWRHVYEDMCKETCVYGDCGIWRQVCARHTTRVTHRETTQTLASSPSTLSPSSMSWLYSTADGDTPTRCRYTSLSMSRPEAGRSRVTSPSNTHCSCF